MNQVNVNPPPQTTDTGEHAVGAGMNLLTVLIVVALLVAVAWFVFAGPLQNLTRGDTVNINVNPPAQTEQPSAPKVNVDAPSQPAVPKQP